MRSRSSAASTLPCAKWRTAGFPQPATAQVSLSTASLSFFAPNSPKGSHALERTSRSAQDILCARWLAIERADAKVYQASRMFRASAWCKGGLGTEMAARDQIRDALAAWAQQRQGVHY